jgi:hypothetical protein
VLSSGLRLSALACVLAAAALFYGPHLARVDLFYDDAAHHIFWLYRFTDANLFPNDLSVAYFQTSAPWGYRALYAAVAQVADVLQASEWIALALFLGSAWLVWQIALAATDTRRELYGLFAVLILVAFLPLSTQRDFLPATGFQRTFALPLLLLTLWGLATRTYAAVGVSWLGAALFYPVVLPVQGLGAAIVFAREFLSTRRMPPRWKFNAALGVTALGVAAFSMPVPPEIGPALTYEQAMQTAEFGPGGRLDIYHAGGTSFLRDYSTGLGWSPRLSLLMAAGLAAAWGFGRRKSIPFAAWSMVAVGVGLWAAMRLFPEELMFGLYLPNRHSRWAIGIFGIFAIAAGAVACLERASGSGRRIERWAVIGAPLIAVATLLPYGLRLWNWPVDTHLEDAYAFIATLPETTLVAAHPDLADFVPVRARRSVLTSTETSMAWMQGYYAQMKPRVEASLRAAYATRIEDLDAALAPFGVDVFLSGPQVWNKTEYFRPFDTLVASLHEKGAHEGFVLEDPPPDRILFKSGDYYVVRVGKCTSGC